MSATKAAVYDVTGGPRDDAEPDDRCGYGRCKPGALQTCNNSKVMLFVMCFLVFAQGFVVNGVFNVNVSSLERRFLLNSSQLGMVAGAYDFSAAIFGVIFAYLGSGQHKARWLTMAAIMLGLGALVSSLPHFTTGLYSWEQDSISTCDLAAGNGTSSGLCGSSDLPDYVGVFVLGMILFGVGGAVIYTIGIVFIDDSVTATTSPLYMGIFFGFAAFGPGIGFIVGGLFLNMYVDFDTTDTTHLLLEKDDARWVGAWWLGNLLTLAMFAASAIALSCFGAELPSAKDVRLSRESQLHKGEVSSMTVYTPSRTPLKSVPGIVLALLRNPPFLFTTLAGVTEGIVIGGYSTFVTKFVENHFRLSSGQAGIQAGIAIVLGLMGGISFGGFFCRCFRLRVGGMLKFAFACCLLSLAVSPMTWASCGQTELAGYHRAYTNSDTTGDISDTCNENCGCTTEIYDRVCDDTGKQYFSPCHAGCLTASDDEKTYRNCSCVPTAQGANISSVTTGGCQEPCNLLYLFLPLLFFFMFMTMAADVPAEQAVLRSIDDSHRAMMCGLNRFVIRLAGSVPGPVIFGALTDSACLVWQTDSCGENTSCWLYDAYAISRNYFIIIAVMKCCSLIFFFLSFWLYKPPNVIYNMEDASKHNSAFRNESFTDDFDVVLPSDNTGRVTPSKL